MLLAIGLTIAFGVFRYLPFVSFPAGGLLADFIVLAIDICCLRWYVDLKVLYYKSPFFIGAICVAVGIGCYFLPYHSQGIIQDFTVNFNNGYVGSSSNTLFIGLYVPLSLSAFKFADQHQSLGIDACRAYCFACNGLLYSYLREVS